MKVNFINKCLLVEDTPGKDDLYGISGIDNIDYITINVCRRPRKSISGNHILIGKPTRLDLTSCELEAIREASIDVPDPLFVYPHLVLKDKNRIITSQASSRAVKRNNSCVKYTKNNSDCYGALQTLILVGEFGGQQCCYALVQCLDQAMLFLCSDTVT